MTREELVRLAVLMNIADACEEPVRVYQRVAGDLGPCGLWVAPEETQDALIKLTESGLAKAYRMSGAYSREPSAAELQGVPPFDGSYNYYFYITEDGLRSLAIGRAREDWPLDDECELIPGWPGVSD
jgi:hypothetical protein